VRALLGLEADPLRRRLIVDPVIPRPLGALELIGIEVLGARVHLRARERSFEVVKIEGDVEVVGAAR
jgi:hypothetical protein